MNTKGWIVSAIVCTGVLLIGCSASQLAQVSQAGDEEPATTPVAAPSAVEPLDSPSPIPPTATPTPTSADTPTPTSSPTATPDVGQRLTEAQLAFEAGDYARAQAAYTGVLTDPGAPATDRQQATFWLARSQLEAGDYQPAIQTFERFIQDYPADARVAWAYFMQARAYEAVGDAAKAIAAYRQYLKRDGTLAMYAYEGIGQNALQVLDYAQAVQAYNDAVQAAPDARWTVLMREHIAEAELARGNPAAAVQQYDAILSIAKIDAYRSRILYLAGQALTKAGDTKAAYQRYAQAVNQYPTTAYAYQSLVELVNAGVPVDDYQRGLVDYYAKAYQPAIEALTRAVKASPDAHDGDGHWYLAMALKANGNLTQAIERFQKLIQDYPRNSHLGEAWLNMAQAYAWRDDSPAQAIKTYRTFASRFPQSPLAATALWEAANLEINSGDWKTVSASLHDLANRYPQADQAPLALFTAGLLDYRRAQTRTALSAWRTLIDRYPRHQSATAARFWIGKTYQTANDPEKAKAAFQAASRWAPENYYGLRAAETLDGRSTQATHTPGLAHNVTPGSQAEAEQWLAGWLSITTTTRSLAALSPVIVEQPAWWRGNALLQVGRRRDALQEFEAVKDAWWDDALAMYQLALAFRDRGAYRLSIVCAERVKYLSPANRWSQVPALIQQLAYPIYFEPLLIAEAEARDLDPLLLAALVRQESLFEPSATSIADARGLAQVIPDTGNWIASRLNWGNLRQNDLWLPYISIKFGAFYLRTQLNAFNGEMIPALAAYNAGPGNVSKWLKATPDLDLLVETMAYSEPRRYVRRIYEAYSMYRRLYR